MKIKDLEAVKNTREAINFTIAWQSWGANQHMYMSELIRWQNAFKKVASKFRLVKEFKENGII